MHFKGFCRGISIFMTLVLLLTLLLGCSSNTSSSDTSNSSNNLNTSSENIGKVNFKYRTYTGGIAGTDYGRWLSRRFDAAENEEIVLNNNGLKGVISKVSDTEVVISFPFELLETSTQVMSENLVIQKGVKSSFITGNTDGYEIEIEYLD